MERLDLRKIGIGKIMTISLKRKQRRKMPKKKKPTKKKPAKKRKSKARVLEGYYIDDKGLKILYKKLYLGIFFQIIKNTSAPSINLPS